MAISFDINPRLKANVRDEPKQMLQPISGYENEPLLFLEEACKPLEKILGQELQQNVMIAKMNSKEPKDGLTQDESASIHLYTMEWNISENSLYTVLNRTLRATNCRSLQPWFKYLKLFLTAFYKLPASEHPLVWRGVREDFSPYLKGEEVTWWGVSSCTTSISVLEASYYVGNTGPRTMFSIVTNSGKSIQSHSYYQQEDEILLPPGTYLKVVDKCCPAEDLHIIHLREISPPYKMLADPFDRNQWKQTSPLIKQSIPESESTTNAASEPFEEVSLEKEELMASNNHSSFSRQLLYCKGRACTKCGFCRDWYWRRSSFYGKYYEKRVDATCTYLYGYDLLYGYYHYYGDYNYSLCACDDNCS